MSHEDSPDDMERFRAIGSELLVSVDRALGPWLANHVGGLCRESLAACASGVESELEDRLNGARELAIENLRRMTGAEIDEAVSGPLEQIRSALVPLTDWLQTCGAAPNGSPDSRPDDPFGFGPVTFRDLSDGVHDAGIRWGAAKAFMHQQHRSKRP